MVHVKNHKAVSKLCRLFSEHCVALWRSGKGLELVTQRLRVRVPPEPLNSGNNLEQVIYTHGTQANSAFHPSGVGK